MEPIINLDALEFVDVSHGQKFQAKDGGISHLIGAKQLGYSLIVVPPGKRAYPFHCHHINEEAFFILEGRVVLRIGKEEHPIRKGDVIAAPAGGKETAHQIINTSDEELRYLALSTNHPGEICEYPDSSKIGIAVGSAPGESPVDRTINWRGRLGPNLDYWDGE